MKVSITTNDSCVQGLPVGIFAQWKTSQECIRDIPIAVEQPVIWNIDSFMRTGRAVVKIGDTPGLRSVPVQSTGSENILFCAVLPHGCSCEKSCQGRTRKQNEGMEHIQNKRYSETKRQGIISGVSERIPD